MPQASHYFPTGKVDRHKVRQPGYYWVKHRGDWKPAQYSRYGFWMLIGADGSFDEEELDEVGEKLEP